MNIESNQAIGSDQAATSGIRDRTFSDLLQNEPDVRLILEEVRGFATVEFENASYIQRQLPSVSLDAPLREATVQVFSQLLRHSTGLLQDVGHLSRLLYDTHSSEVIKPWLLLLICQVRKPPLSAIDAVVRSIDSAARNDSKLFLAFLLISESATNILTAFNQMSGVLERLGIRRKQIP